MNKMMILCKTVMLSVCCLVLSDVCYAKENLEEITKIAVDFSLYANTPRGKDAREKKLDERLEGEWNARRESYPDPKVLDPDVVRVALKNNFNGMMSNINPESSDDQDLLASINVELLNDIIKHEKYKKNKFEQHYGYAIGEKDNVYVISFRGTHDGVSLIITDILQAQSKEFLKTNTHVHNGFELSRQAAVNKKMLGDFIKKIKKASDPIVIITGHSLGAGMAVLQAADFLENKIVDSKNLYLITFAEPPPGQQDFVDRYKNLFDKDNYYYWSNKKDPVPKLPTIVGYTHMGNEVKFDSSKKHSDKLKEYQHWRHDIKHYFEEINKDHKWD